MFRRGEERHTCEGKVEEVCSHSKRLGFFTLGEGKSGQVEYIISYNTKTVTIQRKC